MSRRLRKIAPVAVAISLAAGLIAGVPIASGAVTRVTAGAAAASAAQATARALPRVTPVISCGALAAIDFSNVPDASAYILLTTEKTVDHARYCEASGYIAPQVQFQLNLPVTTYTGLYMQAGCGGFCGSIPGFLFAVGNQAAVAADDQGHVGGEADALWASEDPALRVSFGYTSEHALAQAAKAIITAYYGKPPAYSYFDGCSGGGREALVEAQRYPRDFNGILAGAPAAIEAQVLGTFPAWLIAVNTNAQGHEILTSEKLPALHAAVLKACGNAQGLIEDPRSCGFNPAAIQCPAGTDNSSCLTPAQVTTARDIYLGPNDGHGHWLYPGGEPYGSELAWGAGEFIDPAADARWPADTHAYQVAINYLKYMGYWKNPPASFQLSDVRFTLAFYHSLVPLAGIYNADDPDMSAFQKDGGKLIIYQGWADQEVPPTSTVDYYKAVARQAGGVAASQSFSRLYMVPDQYHCLSSGFPPVTFQLMTPLMKWVEQRLAPGTLSFPLQHPTATLKAIPVSPLDPLSPPPGGARGLNTRYRWVGRFRPGGELWCATEGTDLVCRQEKLPTVSASSASPAPPVAT